MPTNNDALLRYHTIDECLQYSRNLAPRLLKYVAAVRLLQQLLPLHPMEELYDFMDSIHSQEAEILSLFGLPNSHSYSSMLQILSLQETFQIGDVHAMRGSGRRSHPLVNGSCKNRSGPAENGTGRSRICRQCASADQLQSFTDPLLCIYISNALIDGGFPRKRAGRDPDH